MMRMFSLAAAVSAAVGLGGTAAQAQSTKFDGSWSVQVLTERGECEKVYRFPVVVQEGRIRYGGSEGFTATGQVAANGAISSTISYGQTGANVRGRLSGGSGTGTWQASGGVNCGGRWNAERRG